MRMHRPLLTGCALGLMLASAGCDRMKPGRRAPDLSIQDLQGRPVSLRELRGRVVLVGFFATWAPPCRLAMLTWARHQRAFGRRGLVVIGVAVREEAPVLARTFKAVPPGFTVGLGPEPVVEDWLGAGDQVLPSAYLIDGTGRIQARYQGVFPGDAMVADIERAIEALPALNPREGK